MPYPKPLQILMRAFATLPGVGPRTAERFALSLVQGPKETVRSLARALVAAAEETTTCARCFTVAEINPCTICRDTRRDQGTIAVVAEPQDIQSLERTGEYRGVYFVLGNLLNPVEGVGPEALRTGQLVARLEEKPAVKEIILALDPTVEGEATNAYLARLLRTKKIRTTRLARGLPAGAHVEFADEATLANALKGRREV